MDDLRFEDLRVQINPQSGADSTVNAVDIDAVIEDVADIVDIGGKILIVAGRPQPPTAVANVAFQSAISNCKIRRLTLSCTIGVEIFMCFGNAE